MFDFSESFEAGVPVGGEETVALAERIFSGADAWLKTRLGMEARPQQTNMARSPTLPPCSSKRERASGKASPT